jgi:S1-C subfamily serine protease
MRLPAVLARLILLGLGFGLTVAPLRAQALELPELAELAKPSVVLLTISDAKDAKAALGTGFFVTKDGRIVTNHHVIDGASKVTATMSDGHDVKIVGILADDPANDIAVLQAVPGDYPPLTLGATTGLRMGDEIAIVGSPLGLSGTLSTGIVSALRESGPPSPLEDSNDDTVASWRLQVSAAISPGSSGSPILNRAGEAVAVAVGQLLGGQGLNFGIPIEIPKRILADIAPNAAPKPFAAHTSSAVVRNLEISGAVFGAPYLGYLVFAARRRRGRSGRVRESGIPSPRRRPS